MNRKFALIFLLAIGFSTLVIGYRVPSANAIIWIEGHITSDTTWAPVDTYRVVNNTYVDPGVTLTILPGVHVQFADGFSLIVEGNLNATGTDTNPIVFTSSRVSPSAGAWNTIWLKGVGSGELVIKHAIIEYGTNAITVEGTSSSEVLIANCSISKNSQNGIYLTGSSVECKAKIVDNRVSFNGGNGIYAYSFQGMLSNTEITTNNLSDNGGDGIYLHSYVSSSYAVSAYLHNISVRDNVVTSNLGNGLHMRSDAKGGPAHGSVLSPGNGILHNAIVEGNVAFNNSMNGILMESFGDDPNGVSVASLCNSTISRNTLISNRLNGMFLYSWGDAQSFLYNISIQDNVIVSNEEQGIYLYSRVYKSGAYTRPGAAFLYNISVSNNIIQLNGKSGLFLSVWSRSAFWDETRAVLADVAIRNNTLLMNEENGMCLLSYNDHDMSYLCNVTVISNKVSCSKLDGMLFQAEKHNLPSPFDLVVYANSLSGNSRGMSTTGNIKMNATNNLVAYNQYGFYYEEAIGNEVHYNNIYENTFGMNVSMSATVNAEYNYWGDSTGPYHSSLNPEGLGNPVNGDGTDLDFIPFLTSPHGYINQRPVAALSVDKITPNIDETVTLDATNSTDDGRIDYYLFNFGDGTSSSWTTLPAVTHKYTLNGTYYAAVTVMDDYGVTSTNAELIKVQIIVVPEFPSFLILPLFMIATLLAVVIYRKRTVKIERLVQIRQTG